MPVELADLTAAILVGGSGTRLRAVVADRPKALVPVRGRPFLAYLLDQVVATGIRQVVLCTGYLGEQVRAEFGTVYRSLNLVHSHESTPLGTAGALRRALPLLQSDSVLVLNGDSFCQADLNEFWIFCQSHATGAALLLTRVADMQRYGQVEVDYSGRVLRFNEKGKASGRGWINAGIYLLAAPFIQMIPASGTVSLEHEMFPAWLDRGLFGYRGGGRFIDIGVPESYAAADAFFA